MDADVGLRRHEEGYDQERTCERISQSGTIDKEDHRENAKEVVPREERGLVLRRIVDAPLPGKIRR